MVSVASSSVSEASLFAHTDIQFYSAVYGVEPMSAMLALISLSTSACPQRAIPLSVNFKAWPLPSIVKSLLRAYRTKSVSGPIIHSFRNGYLVLWWSSSHTRPSPHFSGREASSALMPYRSLSRSTSASVGISRSVSAIVFGHSTCR